MLENLNIALIQSDLTWENPAQNRINFTKKINDITQPVDVIFLPEMFTSGFTMNASVIAETMQGETMQWLTKMAYKKNTAIGGSLIINENEKYYNRFVFMMPNGNYKVYDKKHTFTLAGEHKVYRSGVKKLIVDYKGWRICPLICYDLRFPVLARNTENYDVLVYVASWPKPRVLAWDSLLQARAIENMSYCIGVNRVGLDANGHEYSGHSIAYNCLGESLCHIEAHKEATKTITLSKKHMLTIRKKLGFLNDMDNFTLHYP